MGTIAMPVHPFAAKPSVAVLSLIVLTSAAASTGEAQVGDPPQPASSTAPRDEAVRAELARLQGTWTLTYMEIGGEEIPRKPDASGQAALETPIIQGDSWMEEGPSGKKPELFMNIKLLPSAEPKQIDLVRADLGNCLAGIYKIEGDILTLCVTIADDAPIRPTRFVSRKALPLMLCIYKKRK